MGETGNLISNAIDVDCLFLMIEEVQEMQKEKEMEMEMEMTEKERMLKRRLELVLKEAPPEKFLQLFEVLKRYGINTDVDQYLLSQSPEFLIGNVKLAREQGADIKMLTNHIVRTRNDALLAAKKMELLEAGADAEILARRSLKISPDETYAMAWVEPSGYLSSNFGADLQYLDLDEACSVTMTFALVIERHLKEHEFDDALLLAIRRLLDRGMENSYVEILLHDAVPPMILWRNKARIKEILGIELNESTIRESMSPLELMAIFTKPEDLYLQDLVMREAQDIFCSACAMDEENSDVADEGALKLH